MKYPAHLEKLTAFLRRLPGVGAKTAERYAFDLLDWDNELLSHFAQTIEKIPLEIGSCSTCGALSDKDECPFCMNIRRDPKKLCIVATPKEIFSIEKTSHFNGVYHVLNGLLSPLEGKTLSDETLVKIKERIHSLECKEILIALDSSLEGDATAHYLKSQLAPLNVEIYRLAFGLPIGSALDMADLGTLSLALNNRSLF